MADGIPNLRGSILIDTSTVKTAVKSVENLGDNLKKMADQAGRGSSEIETAIGRQVAAYKTIKKQLDGTSAAYRQITAEENRQQMAIAKMANTVENFSATVRKSNLSQKQQAQILESVGSKFKGFEQAILSGADSGVALQRVTLQFNNALAKSKRELSETSTAINDYNKAWAENESRNKKNESTLNAITKVVAKNEDIYNELTTAVEESVSADKGKAEILASLKVAHDNLNKSIQQYGVNSNQTVKAQIEFDRASKGASKTLKEVGNSAKNAKIDTVAGDFRNLTSAVVVALGPLSGVAARMTALQGIFDRNTVAVGALLAGLTGMSVLFAASARGAQMAEQQMLTLEAQIAAAGDSAQMTAKEINIMAHDLAAATLLSAEQVRTAAGALLQFGEIGRDQFDDVILAAQGMSTIMGGDLKENVRKLGRVMQEPNTQMASLRESIGKLDEDIQRQIISLTEQGRTYEANNILLEQFKGLMEGAQGASKGLAGAYDTVMGNLDKLHEELMLNSGALAAITDNVNTVAKALENFTKSDAAAAIGLLFRDIARYGGNALRAVIDNIEALSFAFASLAAYGIVISTGALLRLGNALTFNVIPSLIAAKGGIAALGISATATTGAVTALNTALTMSPAGRVVMGVVKIASAVGIVALTMETLKNRLENTEESQLSFAASAGNAAEIVLASNRNLTAIQRDSFQEMIDANKSTAEVLERDLYESRQKLLKIEKDFEEKKKRLKAIGLAADKARETRDRFGVDSPDAKAAEDVKKLEAEYKKLFAQTVTLTKAKNSQKATVDDLSNSYDEIVTKTSKLTEEIKTATKADETKEQVNRSHMKLVESLSEEYDKQSREITALESRMKSVTNAIDFFSEGEYENAEAAQQLTRYLEQMGVKLANLKFTEQKQAAKGFFDQIAAGRNTLADLEQVFNMGGTEAAQGFVNMQRNLANVRMELESLVDPRKIQELGNMMNFEGSNQEIINEYIRRREEIDRQVLSQQRLNQLQQEMTSVVQSQQPMLATVAAQYKDMMSVAKTEEQIEAIKRWFAEQQKIALAADESKLLQMFGTQEEIDAYLEMFRQKLIQTGQFTKEEVEKLTNDLAKKKKTTDFWDSFSKGASDASQVVSGAMEVMSIANRQSGKDGKNMAIANAVIAQAMAVANIWGGAGGIESMPAKIALSALAAAKVGAQIAAIKQQKFASGGYVKGPGTGRSDSINAMLSNGEFVMSAAAVRKLGVNNLDKMNKGQMPMFNTGGLVGVTSPGSFSSNTSVQIIDQSTGSKDFMVEETTNNFGQTQIKVLIKNAVKEGIVRGDFNREMAASYGLRQKGRSL